MRGSTLVLFLAASGFTAACESSTEAQLKYGASLDGAQESPSVTTTGTGTFTATIDRTTNIMTYNLSFTGLESNSILAHIHGPAAAGVNAGVLVDLDAAGSGRTITLGSTSGTGSGTVSLALSSVITATVSGDSLRRLFDAGQLYVNVHTANNGGGEIRGQIAKQ